MTFSVVGRAHASFVKLEQETIDGLMIRAATTRWLTLAPREMSPTTLRAQLGRDEEGLGRKSCRPGERRSRCELDTLPRIRIHV